MTTPTLKPVYRIQLPWAVYLLPFFAILPSHFFFGGGGMGGFLLTSLCQLMPSLGGQVLRQLIKMKFSDLSSEPFEHSELCYPLGPPPPELRFAVWCWQILPRRFFFFLQCYTARLLQPQPRVCVCVRVDCDTVLHLFLCPFSL